MITLVILCAVLFTSLTTGVPTAGQQPYQATGVQNLDPNAVGGGGDFLDIAIGMLPQIESIVQNFTNGASPDAVKDVKRFKDIIELFIPFMRKSLEFEAQDKGRAITQADLEALENVGFALNYISDLALSELHPADASGIVIPDYTDLIPNIPDINIPSVVIPQQKIPDVVIPKIEIPGGSSIPERKISLQSVPEVNIPGRNVPVTHRSVSRRPEIVVTNKRLVEIPTTKPLRTGRPTTALPTTKPQTTEPHTTRITSSRVSPSSLLRQNKFLEVGSSAFLQAEPKQSEPFRHVPQSAIVTDKPATYHALPGGGFSYRVYT